VFTVKSFRLSNYSLWRMDGWVRALFSMGRGEDQRQECPFESRE